MKKKWIKRLWVIIPSGFLGLLIGIWLSYTINAFWKDQQLANAYIATFTMILALATAFLALFTWRIIRSGIEREKRDRKEGLLNEIIGWAIDILEFSTAGSVMDEEALELIMGGLPNISDMYSTHRLENKARGIASTGVYIEAVASKSIQDPQLQEQVSKVRQNLRNHIRLLDLDIRGKLKNKGAIGKHVGRLFESARELIEYAVEIIPIH